MRSKSGLKAIDAKNLKMINLKRSKNEIKEFN